MSEDNRKRQIILNQNKQTYTQIYRVTQKKIKVLTFLFQDYLVCLRNIGSFIKYNIFSKSSKGVQILEK